MNTETNITITKPAQSQTTTTATKSKETAFNLALFISAIAKSTNSLNFLTDAGFDIEVNHYRYDNSTGLLAKISSSLGHKQPVLALTGPELRIHAYGPRDNSRESKNVVGSYIYPNGGKTVVQVTAPDGTKVHGAYKTPITEPFNRRYSLERALKQAYVALRERSGLTREERIAGHTTHPANKPMSQAQWKLGETGTSPR